MFVHVFTVYINMHIYCIRIPFNNICLCCMSMFMYCTVCLAKYIILVCIFYISYKVYTVRAIWKPTVRNLLFEASSTIGTMASRKTKRMWKSTTKKSWRRSTQKSWPPLQLCEACCRCPSEFQIQAFRGAGVFSATTDTLS